MRSYEEPDIGGERLEVSQSDFERSCKVLVWEEQNKLNPNNAIIATLCNGVRLSREYCHAMKAIDRADLLESIKALEVENSSLKPNLQQMTVDAHQAHVALKLALGALELARHHFIRLNAKNLDQLTTMPTPYDSAIEAIKACGVTCK